MDDLIALIKKRVSLDLSMCTEPYSTPGAGSHITAKITLSIDDEPVLASTAVLDLYDLKSDDNAY